MKTVLYLVLAVVAFAGSIVGVLAATGNLSKEGWDKIVGKAPPKAQATAEEAPDDLDPLLRAAREREKNLDAREAELREREERVKTAESDLRALRHELGVMLEQYTATLDREDAEKQQQRQEVAALLEKMKPDQAADIISTKEPEEAVALFRLIPEKNRPKVLDKLEPDRAAAIIDALQRTDPVAMP